MTSPTETSHHEIVITRVLDAPRELVFQAWTDPRHIAQWWGPHGFTTPVCEMDVRPGGVWHYIMRGRDGSEYPLRNEYVEVTPPERIVYTSQVEPSDIWNGNAPPDAHHTVTFEAQDGKTLLTIRTLLGSTQERDAMVARGYIGGMTQSLERLETVLVTLK